MDAPNTYDQLIEAIFFNHYSRGSTGFDFARTEIEEKARELGLAVPKNLGDVIYSFRYRRSLPESVRRTAPPGKDWIIRPAGHGKYRFAIPRLSTVEPTSGLAETKVPDSTPGLITMYAFTDEQSLLAVLRYNRLIDIFTRVACYSLQSHLRTTVLDIGQVETDELYVGVDRRGAHYAIPVQAKGGSDMLSVVQIEQDFALCDAKFPDLIARPVAAQFIARDLVALFEFERDDDGEVAIVTEKHYRLAPPDAFTAVELATYAGGPID